MYIAAESCRRSVKVVKQSTDGLSGSVHLGLRIGCVVLGQSIASPLLQATPLLSVETKVVGP